MFTDGLGVRRRTTDPVRHDPIELLCLRGDLTSVPSFEFALRERVSHLSGFRHGCYANVRSVERLKNPPAALVLVSDVTSGVRLSEVLAFAENAAVPLDIDAALCLLRQIVPALAMLHEEVPDVSNGAIAPERIVVTPSARIVIVEHVLGAALNELQYTRDRYWKELRIALPGTTGTPTFDQRADVAQLGAVALALILGRPLSDEEVVSHLGEVVASSWAISSRGGLEPLPAGLRSWLMRALQLDTRESFDSAIAARDELERVLGDSDYLAAPASLEAFLAHYRAETGAAAPVLEAAWTSERAADPVRQVEPTASAADALIASILRPSPAPEPAVAGASPSATTPGRNKPADNVVRPPDVVRTADANQVVPLAAATTPDAAPPAPVKPPGQESSTDRGNVDRRFVDRSIAERSSTERPAPIVEHSHTAHAMNERPVSVNFGAAPEEPSALPASNRRWWPAAAAVAVLALAGVAVPTARYLTAPPPVVDGTLSVTTNPPGAHLFVDGVERGVTPLSVPLKPGSHSLEVRGDGAPRLLPITIVAGAQVSQYLELPKAAAAVGQLHVRTEPAGARVSVDGVGRGSAPVTVSELTPGEHSVVVESDLGLIKQSVTIEAGVTASLTVPLGAPEGAPVSGWINIAAPAELQIFENKRLLGTSQMDRLMVSTGRHELELVNETLGYRATRTVQVAAGKVTPVRLEFPKGTIALNAIPWAEVWVDGEKVGDTPIGNLSVTIGTHDVTFRNPDLGEQRHQATVTLVAPARLSVDLRKK
jgi:PEGA domain-containing protein